MSDEDIRRLLALMGYSKCNFEIDPDTLPYIIETFLLLKEHNV